MFEQIAEAKRLLKELVAQLQPETFDGAAAAQLVEEFTAIERIAAAGKALSAARVAQSGVWRREGDRSPARWMARTTGTSVGHALGVLQTAEQVAQLPTTETALRSGELSEVQAKEIVAAAAASPSSEQELLATAKTESVSELRERCAKIKSAACSDELERYEAIRARRRLRHWRDPDGAFHLDAVLTPDAGAVVVAALTPYSERIFQEARKQGRRESHDAYAADALVELAEHTRGCDNDSSRRGPGAVVHVLADHQALLRGSTEDGETCEIAGVGPVPVATAQALAGDAFLRALVTDGTDVKAVSHAGRTIPARLRTALEQRDRTCVVPGCDVRRHLQIDHIRPVPQGGRTCLANLDRLCPWHHYLKTHRGYQLHGPPGSWRFEPPERPPPREGPDGTLQI